MYIDDYVVVNNLICKIYKWGEIHDDDLFVFGDNLKIFVQVVSLRIFCSDDIKYCIVYYDINVNISM